MTKKTRVGGTIAAASLLALAGITIPSTAASAADFTVHNLVEMQAALADCTHAPKTITVAADIDDFGAAFTVNCDTTLNLLDNYIYASNVIITPGNTLDVYGTSTGTEWDDIGTLQINGSVSYSAAIKTTGATLRVNSGRVIADAAASSAAIGGSAEHGNTDTSGGTLIVNGGQVIASGAQYGYGAVIGGGSRFYSGSVPAGHGGTVEVNGGELRVEANAEFAVGIGGGGTLSPGGGGNGANVTVTGGKLTVVANGEHATAIGGGAPVEGGGTSGVGGTLTVGAAGSAEVRSAASVFGGGWNPDPAARGAFGSLTVDGTLYAAAGTLDVVDGGSLAPEIMVGATGKIFGGIEQPTLGATITGTGQIANGGAIALAPAPTMVTGNNRLYTFDPAHTPVHVFAPSFTAGHRVLPAAPAGQAWNTENDGTGEWFTADSVNSGTGSTQLFASVPGVIEASALAADLAAVAGSAYDYPVTVLGVDQQPLVPQPAITYTSENCALPSNGVFTVAGQCEVTASTVLHGVTVSTQFTVNVVAGPLHTLAMTAPQASVPQGGSLTFDLTGVDAHGNPVDTSAAVLTSNVATDVIDGRTVSFPTASPHVITATLGTVTHTFTVEVVPAGAPSPADGASPATGSANSTGTALAQTGGSADQAGMLGLAGLLLLATGGVVTLARQRASAKTTE